ncbi:MAG: helix-turn-helix domain-containing protein [bacterium]|nr:helix-turn-helix domain-containing protein [bacterium]
MKKLLKPDAVADLLGISPRKLWTITNQGDLPCIRIGRCLRYDEQDVAEWIERKKRRGTRE